MIRDRLFSESDAAEFQKAFAISFMANYVSSRYSECCSHAKHQQLREPPVEDAQHLAEEAWREWVDKVGLNPTESDPI